MTDQQVIETLARREGWTQEWTTGVRVLSWWKAGRLSILPDYLNSHDALAPVLVGLSEDEKQKFIQKLEDDFTGGSFIDYDAFAIHLLTLPPHTLAHAIAEALEP